MYKGLERTTSRFKMHIRALNQANNKMKLKMADFAPVSPSGALEETDVFDSGLFPHYMKT